MPKPHTFPTLYDECSTISMKLLKEWGYLETGSGKEGVLTWGSNSVKVRVICSVYNPYLELSYLHKGEPISYRVDIIRKPSNLGLGEIYYFICPKTGKACRKLYLIGAYFYHREAFTGCMYDCQTYSKLARKKIKAGGFHVERIYEEIYSPYFTRFYDGHPTRRYHKLCSKLAAEGDTQHPYKRK